MRGVCKQKNGSRALTKGTRGGTREISSHISGESRIACDNRGRENDGSGKVSQAVQSHSRTSFAVDCSDVRSIRPVGPSARVSRRAPESSDNVYQRTNLPARAITGTSRNHRHAYARCDHKSSEECMHRGWTLGWVAFMILCSPGANVTAAEEQPRNAIRVLEATYGVNCEGVGKGNVTKVVASACDGTDRCNYRGDC